MAEFKEHVETKDGWDRMGMVFGEGHTVDRLQVIKGIGDQVGEKEKLQVVLMEIKW